MTETQSEVQSEARAVYLRLKRNFGDPSQRTPDARKRATKSEGNTVPFGAGRDPEGLSAVIDSLTSRLGWNSNLARNELLATWATIAGADTADHSSPVGIEEGVLTVQCDSTAWAQQLRLMRVNITTEIARRFPDAGIEAVRFLAPNAPSWKRGPRSVPGRGPRDTYG